MVGLYPKEMHWSYVFKDKLYLQYSQKYSFAKINW